MSNIVTGVNDPYYTITVSGQSTGIIMSVTARWGEAIDSDNLSAEQMALLDDVVQTIVQAVQDRSDVSQAVGLRHETTVSYITAT